MKKLRKSMLNPIIFLIVLWSIKWWENASNLKLVGWGIYPRDFSGLKGVITWVFIHGDDSHLFSNTFPLLILGSALYYFYDKLANKVLLIIYLFTGVMVWIIGNPAFHIGASGIIYGIFSFLFFGGIFRKDKISIAISLLVTVFYGSMIWGIFPAQKGVSWEGHSMGFLAGLIAAVMYRKQYLLKSKTVGEVKDYRDPDWNIDLKLDGGLYQAASSVVMIRPKHFGFNPQTAESNAFQQSHELLYDRNLNTLALKEFDSFVNVLRSHGIQIYVFEDQVHEELPDAIFPNNWISMHHGGELVYYPMLTENRRSERREDVIDILIHGQNFLKTRTIDLTSNEKENKILEGTGSMVLDHNYRVAFANLSPRTDRVVFEEWCTKLKYHPVSFEAKDESGNDIYHTNVLLSVGEGFVVICWDALPDQKQQKFLKRVFDATGKTVIPISMNQMNNFCGNILQLNNPRNEKLIAMSTRAFDNFLPEQKQVLSRFGKLIHSDLATVENFGGGSARCMLAEVFLPKVNVR